MLFGLFVSLFVIVCFLLILIILVQQGKGGMGLGSLGGGTQMLFGGSGGQELFEKVTWIMGALFIFGALGLTILKTREAQTTRVKQTTSFKKTQPKPAPKPPVEKNN